MKPPEFFADRNLGKTVVNGREPIARYAATFLYLDNQHLRTAEMVARLERWRKTIWRKA